MLNKIIKKLKERIELAQNRNFKVIHLALKPREAELILKALKRVVKESNNND